MKKTLIILPGWGGTKETWATFVQIATESFDVHIIELPCFGEEPCPNEVWGVEEYSNFVKNRISEIRTCFIPSVAEGKSEICLLGHSFGGQVATYLVAYNPNLVDKLILSGASVFRRRKKVKQIVCGALAKVGKIIFSIPGPSKLDFVARKILYRLAQSPDYLKTNGIQREIFKKITVQNVSSELPKIKIPTLVVWGDTDTYVPIAEGKKIASGIPHAQLQIISGGTHGLHIKNTEQLFKIIKKFASGV